ncbi:MAG: tetratricopeptide repeat protein [Candidatus Manganitrophus sp.]|nr:tetratricopeptide repeat protein [Candidatus Manganitrophus sp.]
MYAARGDLAPAEEMIRKGIEADPTSGLGYYYLGKISFEKKSLEDALQYYQKALSLHPYFEQAHLEVARIYELQEKTGRGRKDLPRHSRKSQSKKPRGNRTSDSVADPGERVRRSTSLFR